MSASFSQDGDLRSQGSGVGPSGRLGSSHGVIRGNHVQVLSGSSGHAIGRLGGATIPQPPEFGEDVSIPRAPGSSNYFGRVSSKRLSVPDNNTTLSSDTSATSRGDEAPAASLPWANEAYKQRLTLSRQGGRPKVGTTNATTPVRNQLPACDAETMAVHDALVPQEGEAQIERRTSLISGALGRRRQSNPALVHKTQTLAAKQDYIRCGGGGELVSTRSSFSSVTTSMAVAPLGSSGFESRPSTSGGVGRPTTSGGTGVAPVNPLTNRTQNAPTAGRRVGHLQGSARESNNTAQTGQRAPVDEHDGCLCC